MTRAWPTSGRSARSLWRSTEDGHVRREHPVRSPYGRGEAWQDNPEGWPDGRQARWYWRSDADSVATWGPTSRPVPQWTRPGATPVETLGRQGHHH